MLIAMLTFPRSRIIPPLPAIPELCMTVIPGTRPWSMLSTLAGGSMRLSVLSWLMEFPTSRRRAAPAVAAVRRSAPYRTVRRFVPVPARQTAWRLGSRPPQVPRDQLQLSEAVRAERDAVQAAERAWTTTWTVPCEDRDPEHRLVFGDVVEFEALLAQAPWPDDHGDGWPDDEPARFGRCARRLWDPILDLEEVDDW